MKKSLRIFAYIMAVLLILLGSAVFALSTDTVEQWLCNKGIEILSQKLNTRIKVDRVSVSFRHGGVTLYGLEMDDLSHVTMLKVDTFEAGIEWFPLLHNQVIIDKIFLHGADAVFYKEHPDTAANYQFVIDAFKTKSKKGTKTKKHGAFNIDADLKVFDVSRCNFSWDVKSLPPNGKGTLDGAHLHIRDFGVNASGNMMGKNCNFTIRRLRATDAESSAIVNLNEVAFHTIKNVSIAEIAGLSFSLPGKKTHIDNIIATKEGELKDTNKGITIKARGLSYQTDNGKPRKNVRHPKRGAFDVGHLDITANADITIADIHKDTLLLNVVRLDMTDKGSGLIVRHLTSRIEKYGNDIFIRNTRISMPKTKIILGTAHLTLTKYETSCQKSEITTHKPKTSVTIAPFPVSAKFVLTDIAKPFAPVLSNFTTPLNLHVVCQGTLDRILYRNIRITTSKKRLIITAQGDMCNVTKKRQLNLHFWNINMSARNGIKEQIVGHFAKMVNLKMQRQMRLVGDMRYHGTVGIFYKRENIAGKLFTKFGNADFAFTINGFTKYMTGTVKVVNFEIGKLMNANKVGAISAFAKYSFNTSKNNKDGSFKKGKLPHGTLSAKIDGAKYNLVHTKLFNINIGIKHITADFTSDGSTAKGVIIAQHKIRDIAIDVIYHQTIDDQSFSYKVRLQKISAEDKALRKAAEKAEKDAAKAKKKADKAAAKAAKAAAKAAKKQADAQAADDAATNGPTSTAKKKFLCLF